MEVHTRHAPTCGVARVLLAGGESVRCDLDAMLASSFGITLTSDGRSGKRAPTVFTAPAEGGWIDLAPADHGDVYPLRLDGTGGWCVADGAVLAQPATVRQSSAWPGLRVLFGSEPGFLRHYAGHGALLLASTGPVDAFELAAGELISMRPAYLLAYPDSMQCRLRAIDPALPQTLRTGDGLMLDFAGPGTILARTRS